MCHSIHWINQITRECDSHLCCSNRTEKFHYTPFDLIIDFSVQCSVFVRLINNTHSMVFHQSVEKNRNQINYVGNLSNSVSCNLIRHALHVSIVALLQPLMAHGWCCAYARWQQTTGHDFRNQSSICWFILLENGHESTACGSNYVHNMLYIESITVRVCLANSTCFCAVQFQ